MIERSWVPLRIKWLLLGRVTVSGQLNHLLGTGI